MTREDLAKIFNGVEQNLISSGAFERAAKEVENYSAGKSELEIKILFAQKLNRQFFFEVLNKIFVEGSPTPRE